MKFEKLQPGMTVYDVGSHQMGNTTLKTISVWAVKIVSVDPEKRSVQASWNGNPVRTFHEGSYSKWKAKRPVLIRTAMGALRRPTREELKAMKDAQKPSAA